MRVIVDVEYDNLNPYEATKIHCIVCRDYDTGVVTTFTSDEENYLGSFRVFAAGVDRWIGHNIIGADSIVLRLLAGYTLALNRMDDTLVLSRLYNPVRDLGHSLERWGAYFHAPKVGLDIEDWSTLTPQILERCIQDVAINARLYTYLCNEGRGFSEQSRRLEHAMAYILSETKRYGWSFDGTAATKLYQECAARADNLKQVLRTAFPRTISKVKDYAPRPKMDGSVSSIGTAWMAPDLVQATGPCSVIEYEDFDPGSTKQIVKQLRGFWRPTEFTPKGSPKVNESNLQTITDDAPDAAKLLGEFKILTNRVIMLKTWLNALGEGDRIHGSIISCGANTHRASHYGPNTANIPASISKRGTPNLYGAECRRLWAVSGEDRVLVGVDAASIQLRILAHLRNNTAFTSHIESGDAHQYHADLTGYSRIVMKTFIYAWLLGCGNARAGFILGGSPKDGKELIETFLARNPDLVALKAKALDWARQGYYVCSDGRRISIKEPHYALAVALQGEEQAIMKRSIVTWYGQKKQEKLDSHLVGWIHDETQLDTLSDNAGRSGEIMVESIRNAGVFFKYNCKLDGGVKIGKSWADTH